MSNQSATNSHECPEPMTRSQLVTERNASRLEVGCVYTVTDYARGCLLAGTLISLTATAPNELSQLASVNTLLDNTSWNGVYDVDTGRLKELHDLRGNHVYGQVQVDAFPWGDTGWTQVTILEGADVLITGCNTTYTVLECTFHSSAKVDLRNLASGYLRYSDFGSGCDVKYDGAADVRMNNCKFHSGSRDYMSGFQGIAYRLETTFGESSFYQILTTSNITESRLDNSHLGTSAYLRGEAGSSGIWRIYDTTVNSRSEIRKYGSSNWTLYRNNLNSYSRIRGRGAGTERTYYLNMNAISILDQTGGTNYYISIDSQGSLYTVGGTSQRSRIGEAARVNTNGFNLYACSASGSGAVNLTANNTNRRKDQTPFNNFT